MGKNFETEVFICGFKVDFIADNTVIEVNGPYHYIGETDLFTNFTKLKNECLAKAGYRLITLNFEKIDKFKT